MTSVTYTKAALDAQLAVKLELRATPPDPATTVAYIDTTTVPPTLTVWNGTGWVTTTAGSGTTTPTIDGAFLTEAGDYLTLETGDILLVG